MFSLIPRQGRFLYCGTSAASAATAGTNYNPFTTINIFQRRWKHSKTQIKRLFYRNEARIRVHKKLGWIRPDIPPPTKVQFPQVFEPVLLPNGWSAPPPTNFQRPTYPFQITRTKNKPNNAPGFLPVYSYHRKDGTKITTRIKKVTGDRDVFLEELKAVLQLSIPHNPNLSPIRIRTGGTIEVKGAHVKKVKKWLAGLGF